MITTHVLDIARGEPAAGITVILEFAARQRVDAGRPRDRPTTTGG